MNQFVIWRWRINLHACTHKKTSHGPQSWPWWRLVSFSLLKRSEKAAPYWWGCIWIYTRWGVADISIYTHDLHMGVVCGNCRLAMQFDSNAWRCECGVYVFPVNLRTYEPPKGETQ